LKLETLNVLILRFKK